MVFGKVIVSFDVDWLLLPFHHFGLVGHVGVVHLLKIELELVFVGDGYVDRVRAVWLLSSRLPNAVRCSWRSHCAK